jgi:sugar lactone lactonase YvrE
MTIRTPERRAPGGRRARRGLAGLLAVAALAGSAACTAAGPPPKAGCAPGAPPASVPATGPWAGKLCRQASQKPPASLNGILYRDGVLWIASLTGGELVAADATTGEIIGRFGPDQGFATAPDDLAMSDDGTIYWTGQATGDLGVLTTDGHSRTLTNLGPGLNPIAFGPDGQLYVGHAYQAKGLVRVDPATGATVTVNPALATNGFSFGPDGQLYAPTTDTIPGKLVRIDPGTGAATTVVRTLPGIGAGSAKVPPPARGDAASTVYALTAIPVVVSRWNVTTGRKAGADIRVPFLLADNMTFAPDGRLFVTGFNTPSVAVIGLDGRARAMPIGKA